MANSNYKHFIFVHDRYIHIFRFNSDGVIIHKESIDLPIGIVSNGFLQDVSHFNYLIKKYFEDNKLKREKTIFVFQSTEIITRSIAVPNLTDEEISSLAENEVGNIFVQDLQKYEKTSLLYKTDSDKQFLVFNIIPKALLRSYEKIFVLFNRKSIHYISKDILFFQYLEKYGKGEIWNIDQQVLGYYLFNEEEIYGKTSLAEAMNVLSKEYSYQYSEIENLLRGSYDERTVNINREEFVSRFYQALISDKDFIRKISESFSESQASYLTGSLIEIQGLDLLNILEEMDNYLGIITEEDLAELLFREPKLDKRFESKKKKKKIRFSHPLIFTGIGLMLLLLTFFYGQFLKEENAKLAREKIKMEEKAPENIQVPSKLDNNSKEINTLINQIYATKPEEVSISRIFYEKNSFVVNGQVEKEESLDNWISNLKNSINKEINKEPISTIDNLKYFRFTIEDGVRNE